MIGKLAFSKAGHDERTVYMIIAEDEEYVYLCDGRLKTITHPKKKNRKHIQPIQKGYDSTVRDKLLQGSPVRDEEIKRTIKVFCQGKEDSNV